MEDGTGVLAVLETPDRRIVGVATLSASGALSQQGTGSFDFLVHENTLAQAGKLVDFTLRSAPAAIRDVTACFADVDREKVEIARRAGFCKEAMLPEGLTVGSKTFDVARYSRQLQRGV